MSNQTLKEKNEIHTEMDVAKESTSSFELKIRTSSTNNLELESILLQMRNKLNEDCLLEVFKYLSIVELLKICDIDTEENAFFFDFIRDRIIKMRLINCNDIVELQQAWTINKIFETFGRSMTRIKVSVHCSWLIYLILVSNEYWKYLFFFLV